MTQIEHLHLPKCAVLDPPPSWIFLGTSGKKYAIETQGSKDIEKGADYHNYVPDTLKGSTFLIS